MNLAIVTWARGQANVPDPSLHPVVVRTGSGDFYQGTFVRFDPSIQVARDGRLGDYLVNPDTKNWAPRVGVAWSPNSRWTVRSGFGIFYTQDQGNARFDLSRNIAGRRQEIANPDFPNLTFNQPFASPGGTVQLAIPTIFSSAVDRRTPRVVEYMFHVQHQLGRDTVVEVGYLGSESHHLESLTFQNKAVPAPLGAGSVVSRRPFPELGNTQFVANDGNGVYNALSVNVQKRYSGGLTFLASYTWSRAIDNLSGIRVNGNDGTFPQNNDCLSCERGLSTFHVPHRVVGSVLYELPFGKGRAHANTSRLADLIVGGWQASSICMLQAGSPFTIRANVDRANTGRNDDRPMSTGVNANLARGNQDPSRWFDTSQFFLAPYGTFGNTGRSTGIGPGIISWDFATLKNFRIHEEHSLQFRFEAFNLPNHPNFDFPDNGLTSATFGKITGTRIRMRTLQFALKYMF
jgi:hypothetical protein